MEEAFLLSKELNQTWQDILKMEGIERRWLIDRLYRWYKEQEEELKKENSSISGSLNINKTIR